MLTSMSQAYNSSGQLLPLLHQGAFVFCFKSREQIIIIKDNTLRQFMDWHMAKVFFPFFFFFFFFFYTPVRVFRGFRCRGKLDITFR